MCVSRDKLVAMVRSLQAALHAVEAQLRAAQAKRRSAEAQLSAWLPNVANYATDAVTEALEAYEAAAGEGGASMTAQAIQRRAGLWRDGVRAPSARPFCPPLLPAPSARRRAAERSAARTPGSPGGAATPRRSHGGWLGSRVAGRLAARRLLGGRMADGRSAP